MYKSVPIPDANKAADIGRCVKMVQVQLIQTLQINVEDRNAHCAGFGLHHQELAERYALKHLLIFHVDSFPFIKSLFTISRM